MQVNFPDPSPIFDQLAALTVHFEREFPPSVTAVAMLRFSAQFIADTRGRDHALKLLQLIASSLENRNAPLN